MILIEPFIMMFMALSLLENVGTISVPPQHFSLVIPAKLDTSRLQFCPIKPLKSLANSKASQLVVRDRNHNGALDEEDLDAAVVAQETLKLTGRDIGRWLSADPSVACARVIMLGELHNWVPAGIATGLVGGLKEQGLSPTVAYELPPADRTGKPVLQDVADRWNQGEIKPEELGWELKRVFQTNPDFKGFLREDENNNIAGVITALVSVAQVGGKIKFVDKAYFASPQAIGDPKNPRIRRDAVMAAEVGSLTGPVIFMSGVFHSQAKPGLKTSTKAGDAPVFYTDIKNPTGAILKRRFGEAGVVSLAAIFDILPQFLDKAPLKSWDKVIYDPTGLDQSGELKSD